MATRNFRVNVLAVPSWWADDTFHPVNEWKAYGTNGNENLETLGGTISAATLAAGDPLGRQQGRSYFNQNPNGSAIATQYYGGDVDQIRKRMYFTGGGHNVSDNTVACFDFNTDIPRWYQVNPNTFAGLDTGTVINGPGQYPGDIGTGRFASFHTNNDIICHNGYVYIPGMWAVYLSNRTTQRFRAKIPTAPGTALVWEKLGVALGIEGDGTTDFGEDGPVCLVASRNQIWRGGNANSSTSSTPMTYLLDSKTGAVIDSFTRGASVTTVGSKGTSPAASALFNRYGVACEIYPPSSGPNVGRPALVLAYLSTNVTPSRPAGWYLFDVDSLYPNGTASVFYGPLDMTNNTAAVFNPGHAAYSSMHHLHGTQKIYMSYADFYVSGTTYVCDRFAKITIPNGTSAAVLAAAPWSIDEVNPGGTYKPSLTTEATISGKFNLVQNMGDGRPAIVQFVIPASTFTTKKPHVWFVKMPVGGM